MSSLLSHTATLHRVPAQYVNKSISWRIRMRKEHRTKAQTRFKQRNVVRDSSKCFPGTPGYQPQVNLLRLLTIILQLSSLYGLILSTKFSALGLRICTRMFAHSLCFFYLLSFFNSHFQGLKVTL